MRSFNKRENTIINNIIEMTSKEPTSLEEFLEKVFFIEKKGRALIIQTVDNYSVLYLKKALFENEKTRKTHIEQFLELVSLINYLNKNDYIHFLPKGPNKGSKMYFIQDEFNNPQPTVGNIILNKEGDYTSHPESILDKNDKIIYNGTYIDNTTNNFLAANAKSNLFISEQLHELVSNNLKEQPKTKALSKWLPTVSNIITLLMIGGAFYFFWNKIQNYKPDLSPLQSSNIAINKKIDLVETKLNLLDSLIKKGVEEKAIEKSEENVFYGIDISHYNDSIVDQITFSDSISFVICKATEGLHFRDPYFDSNWEALKKKKIIRGAYHFYRIKSNPIRQANHFISVVKEWDSTDITPIVDIEDDSFPKDYLKIDKEKLQINLLKFLIHIEKKTKRKPMIYASKNFANTYLLKEAFARYPLWLAEYNNKKTPSLPKTWKDAGFKIWQKSDRYHFKSQLDDLDVFYGKLEDIYK